MLRSAGAVLLGLVAIFVLSLGTDHVLHVLEVYPPWGEPMRDTNDNALALVYRLVYSVFGCYLTARTAPHAPMAHASVLGAIGVALSTVGAVAAIQMDLGPVWYPVSLVAAALPCAWVGGELGRR